MKEHDLKKTDSAVSYIRYLFDPDEQRIRSTVITVREESMLPEIGKVIHYSGKRYAVYFIGTRDCLVLSKAACDCFKQFYLNKLADAAEEISKFASILAFFE